MARPLKPGLDFIPLDVDYFLDDKIEFVGARFHAKGELIVIRLLCAIYRNGYYMSWDEDKAIVFAKRVGYEVTHSLAKDVVQELVKRGFFDRSMFNEFAILTSSGIQKRYLNATKDRTAIEIIPEYWLLDMPENTPKRKILVKPRVYSNKTGGNEDKTGENAISKVKSSKDSSDEESRVRAHEASASSAGNPEDFSAEEKDSDARHRFNAYVARWNRLVPKPQTFALGEYFSRFRKTERDMADESVFQRVLDYLETHPASIARIGKLNWKPVTLFTADFAFKVLQEFYEKDRDTPAAPQNPRAGPRRDNLPGRDEY